MEFFSIAQSIVAIIGIPLALYSVFLLARQTRHLENSIHSQVYQGLTENAFRIDEMLIEHPEFRRYLYGGEEVNENTPDLDRLLMAVELIVDVFENLNVQHRSIPKSVLSSWENYKDHVLSTPAVAYYLKAHKDWYSPEVQKRMNTLTSSCDLQISLQKADNRPLKQPGEMRRDSKARLPYVLAGVFIALMVWGLMKIRNEHKR